MADKSTLFKALSGSAVMTKAEKLKLLQDLHKLLNEPTNTVVPRAYQEEGQQALAEFKSKPYPSVRLGVKEIASLLVPVLDAIKKLAVMDHDDTDDDDEDDDGLLAPPEEEAEVLARALALHDKAHANAKTNAGAGRGQIGGLSMGVDPSKMVQRVSVHSHFCLKCHEHTAVPLLTDAELEVHNATANAKLLAKKAKAEEGKNVRATGDTAQKTMPMGCMAGYENCFNRAGGQGCYLCENGGQEIIQDPSGPPGRMMCACLICKSNCDFLWHAGDAAGVAASLTAAAQVEAVAGVPTRPPVSFFDLLAQSQHHALNAPPQAFASHQSDVEGRSELMAQHLMASSSL